MLELKANKRLYPKYEEYKDSGIDWLGEIPKDWATKRLKYLFDDHFGGVWGEEENGDDNDLVCIRVADFEFDKLKVSDSELTIRNILPNQQNRILDSGSILLEKSGGGDKQLVGRAVRNTLKQKSVCSNFVEAMVLNEKQDSRFVTYLMASLYFSNINYRSIKQTTGIQNLDTYKYLNEVIPFLPPKEQEKIADYLDKETEKIDKLIEKKQKLIDLLKEKRTALISQAVTKGLDPNVKMKDSGVAWLGQIPDHWEIKKLKYISEIILGKMLQNEASSEKDEYKPYLKAQNIRWENVDVSEVEEMWFKEPEIVRYRLEKFDLLVSEGGEVGRTSIWLNELGECYIQNSVNLVRMNASNANYKFYLYFMMQLGSAKLFDAIVNRVSISHLTREKLKEIQLAYPPIDEQRSISKYINQKSDVINLSIKKLEHQIEKIKEYRTSLISAAVTGKIKVEGEGGTA